MRASVGVMRVCAFAEPDNTTEIMAAYVALLGNFIQMAPLHFTSNRNNEQNQLLRKRVESQIVALLATSFWASSDRAEQFEI
jgi:hypothetical protein